MDLGKRAGVTAGIAWRAVCVLGEFCFLFPHYLVTPDAMDFYVGHMALMRGILQAVIVATFVLGTISVLLIRSKVYGLTSIALATIALLLGGSKAEAITSGRRKFSAGLDYFLLELLDKNFAVLLAFIDVLFGTAHMPSYWPKHYGTTKFQPPETYLGQLSYPFRRQEEGTPYG